MKTLKIGNLNYANVFPLGNQSVCSNEVKCLVGNNDFTCATLFYIAYLQIISVQCVADTAIFQSEGNRMATVRGANRPNFVQTSMNSALDLMG